MGFLLLAPGDVSLDELATSLNVSRASISTETRRLAQIGILERRSRPGDRRDYYTISPNGLTHALEARLVSMRRFQVLLQEADSLADAPEVTERLDAWNAAYREMLAAVEGVLAELRRQQPRL